MTGLFHLEECPQGSSMLYHTKGFPSFLRSKKYSIVYIYITHFIHSSLDRHFGCFHLLANVNNTAMNMGEEISLQDNAFNSSGYISCIYSNSWIIQKVHYLAHTVILV